MQIFFRYNNKIIKKRTAEHLQLAEEYLRLGEGELWPQGIYPAQYFRYGVNSRHFDIVSVVQSGETTVNIHLPQSHIGEASALTDWVHNVELHIKRIKLRDIARKAITPETQTQYFEECKRLMQQAKQNDTIRMEMFQSSVDRLGEIMDSVTNVATSIEELHSCGNKACFAGHVRLSSLFKSHFNFIVGDSPIAQLPGTSGPEGQLIATSVMSLILDVPLYVAGGAIFGERLRVIDTPVFQTETGLCRHPYYGKRWSKVRADHILTFLERIEAKEDLHQFTVQSIDREVKIARDFRNGKTTTGVRYEE